MECGTVAGLGVSGGIGLGGDIWGASSNDVLMCGVGQKKISSLV